MGRKFGKEIGKGRRMLRGSKKRVKEKRKNKRKKNNKGKKQKQGRDVRTPFERVCVCVYMKERKGWRMEKRKVRVSRVGR